jgi:hypothetical protein
MFSTACQRMSDRVLVLLIASDRQQARSGVDGYYMKYREINYQHLCRCRADAITNLGGKKPLSASIEGVIEALLYQAPGNVELLGQLIFALVYVRRCRYSRECYLSRSAEESRCVVPSLCTKSPLFSEMRHIS